MDFELLYFLSVVTFIAIPVAIVTIMLMRRRTGLASPRVRWLLSGLGFLYASAAAIRLLIEYAGHDWPLWYLAGLLACGGLALLTWALLADRARSRKRCPKCWYDMSQAAVDAPLRCPECGRTAKSEKKLLKTRRRWRWAIASVILFLGASFLAVQPKVQRDGWASILPPTVLILGLRMRDNDWAFAELENRTSFQSPIFMTRSFDPLELPDWQLRMVGTTCAQVLDSQRPRSQRLKAVNWMVHALYVRDRVGEKAYSTMWSKLIELLTDPDPMVRAAATSRAADARDVDGSIVRLQSILSDSDPRVRSAAVFSLYELAQAERSVMPHLIATLQDNEPRVRQTAVLCLMMFAETTFGRDETLIPIEPLRKVFESDPNSFVRASCLRTLVRILNETEREAILQSALDDDDETVRVTSLYEAANNPSTTLESVTVARAIDWLQHESADLRAAAADVLLNKLSKRAVQPHIGQIDRIFEDLMPDVRNNVGQLLSRFASEYDQEQTYE